jgi:hypothetical protein
MESKVFLGFLALIISAHIHRVMSDNKLYRHMTIKDLIRTMESSRHRSWMAAAFCSPSRSGRNRFTQPSGSHRRV